MRRKKKKEGKSYFPISKFKFVGEEKFKGLFYPWHQILHCKILEKIGSGGMEEINLALKRMRTFSFPVSFIGLQ